MDLPFSFRPRLLSALRGYDRIRFVQDLGAGLTVAVVALPLAMAFAIGSGLKPEAGLFTSIIAGFLVALLGGSRVQIGGPAGAFIVIVYDIVQQYGVANLIIATALSGVLLDAAVPIITGLSQGCTPIGPVREVTECRGPWIKTLDRRPALAVLKEDVGEKQNLAEKNPEKAKELHAKLLAWRKEVGAPMPTPNKKP